MQLIYQKLNNLKIGQKSNKVDIHRINNIQQNPSINLGNDRQKATSTYFMENLNK